MRAFARADRLHRRSATLPRRQNVLPPRRPRLVKTKRRASHDDVLGPAGTPIPLPVVSGGVYTTPPPAIVVSRHRFRSPEPGEKPTDSEPEAMHADRAQDIMLVYCDFGSRVYEIRRVKVPPFSGTVFSCSSVGARFLSVRFAKRRCV